MHTQSAAQHDTPSAVEQAVVPPIQPRKPWRVRTVEALPDFRLRVRFMDGSEGTVALGAMIHSTGAGVFAALRDPCLFAQVRVEHGAVCWPGGLDLAPDAMHAQIRQIGEWVL